MSGVLVIAETSGEQLPPTTTELVAEGGRLAEQLSSGPLTALLVGNNIQGLAPSLGQIGVERVLVAFSDEPHEELVEIMRSARCLGVHVDVVPRLFDTIGPVGDVNHIEGLPLVSLYRSEQSRPARWAKRALDFTVAASVLFLAWPLFA